MNTVTIYLHYILMSVYLISQKIDDASHHLFVAYLPPAGNTFFTFLVVGCFGPTGVRYRRLSELAWTALTGKPSSRMTSNGPMVSHWILCGNVFTG